MSDPPTNPKIYHITHVDNLAAILQEGALLCDAEMVRQGGPVQAIGLSEIKRRRIEEIAVTCHPKTKVGDYVPFYFCPRSVMLFVIHKANHPELIYRGGQKEIVHLEADLHAVVRWADSQSIPWAFSLGNAGAYHAQFRTGLSKLSELEWEAIGSHDLTDREVKEAKQAEFLVHGRFPWSLVQRIGVLDEIIQARVLAVLPPRASAPVVEVRKDWYY